MPPVVYHTGWPWRSVVMAALAAIVGLAGVSIGDVLVYDQGAVQAGEAWRILTGHFVHCDGEHLLWNLGALLVIGALFERRLGRLFFPLVIVGCLSIGGWLWWWGGLSAYCGLSGVLNTLLAAGLALEFRATGSWLCVMAGIGALAKIFVETGSRQALFTSTSWPSLPEAHLIGFVAGAVFAFVVLLSGGSRKIGQSFEYL